MQEEFELKIEERQKLIFQNKEQRLNYEQEIETKMQEIKQALQESLHQEKKEKREAFKELEITQNLKNLGSLSSPQTTGRKQFKEEDQFLKLLEEDTLKTQTLS